MLCYAVPICAPYATLAKYKFRVKLTPGTGKKGKSAKQAVEMFARMREATSREVALVRAMTDNDLVAAMVGDVKVAAPGVNAMHAAKRSAKKKDGKAKGKA